MGENYHTHFRNLEKFRITPYSPRTKFKNTQNVNSTDSLKLVADASFFAIYHQRRRRQDFFQR